MDLSTEIYLSLPTAGNSAFFQLNWYQSTIITSSFLLVKLSSRSCGIPSSVWEHRHACSQQRSQTSVDTDRDDSNKLEHKEIVNTLSHEVFQNKFFCGSQCTTKEWRSKFLKLECTYTGSCSVCCRQSFDALCFEAPCMLPLFTWYIVLQVWTNICISISSILESYVIMLLVTMGFVLLSSLHVNASNTQDSRTFGRVGITSILLFPRFRCQSTATAATPTTIKWAVFWREQRQILHSLLMTVFMVVSGIACVLCLPMQELQSM